MKNLSFYLIVGLALTGGVLAFANPFDLPLVYAQVSEEKTIFEQGKDFRIFSFGNGTFQYETHTPYFETETGDFIPYRLIEDSNIIQIEINQAKYVFDKNTGGLTTFIDGIETIQSDSYIVRSAELDTDNWFDLDVNQSPVVVFISETNDEDITITVRKQNNEGIFDIDYYIKNGYKATAKFTNEIYPNHKFAFTETLNLANPIISLNQQEIDIRNYVGQTFPRQVLEQNQDLILDLQSMYYNSGLGFDNLWSVGIFEDNKIALDYANVEQTQTQIGQTVELDPTVTLYATNAQAIRDMDNNNICDNAGLNAGSIATSSATYYYKYDQSSSTDCWYPYFRFDTSTIPDSAVIGAGTILSMSANAGGMSNCGVYALDLDPVPMTNNVDKMDNFWTNRSGLDGSAICTYPGNPNTRTVSNQALFDAVKDNLAEDHFTFAVMPNSYYSIGSNYLNTEVKNIGDPNQPYLTVVYTLPPPDDPTALTITQDTTLELDLSWTQTGTVTGFKIERSLDNSSWTTLTSDTGNTNTTYTDTGLSINTLYYYRVFAYDSATSQYSTNPTNANATTWDYPEQVTGLTATGGDPISLSWSVPASDDTIINYKVYRDTVFLKTVTGSSTTDTPPSFGTSYSYTVSAVSSVGEGAQSTSSSATYGDPPDPPTSLTTSITNANTNPLDILVSYSSPTNVGTGTLTGFEIVRDGSVVATVGLVTSYTDTVPSAGTYTYLVRAISTHGTSSDSNTSNITTPTEPSAINNLSATVNSDTQVSLTWSSPSNGGSSITGFIVHQDGVQIATPTSTSYTVTGLTPDTSYTFTVYAVNNVGTSLVSNSETVTTYLSVTGQIDITSTTIQGASAKIEFLANVTSGTPTPTFSNYIIKQGTTTIASGITSPYILKITNPNLLNYTISSTASTHWNTPTISGSTNIQPDYTPNWENGVSYNIVRTTNNLDLFVNRDLQTNWNLTCNYVTTAQILADETGVNGTITSDWYFDDSQAIGDTNTVYIECIDDGVTVLSLTEYNTNRIGGGIALLDNIFSEWTGTPVALFFVLLVAGLFSGRSAPAGILLVLAIVGVLGFIGLLVIDELIWAFILLAGILGIFMGKRFL